MSSPLDEDAPALATVAATAVGLLSDATGPEVGYPGLTGTGDVEDVIAALNRMAANLQQTVSQLELYLVDEPTAGQPAPASGASEQNVAAARTALADVRENARVMAGLLDTAQNAVLALQPRN